MIHGKIVQAGVSAQTERDGTVLMWEPRLVVAWGDRPTKTPKEYCHEMPARHTYEAAVGDLREALGDVKTITIPGEGECRLSPYIRFAATGVASSQRKRSYWWLPNANHTQGKDAKRWQISC